jgi:hypothetical protein
MQNPFGGIRDKVGDGVDDLRDRINDSEKITAIRSRYNGSKKVKDTVDGLIEGGSLFAVSTGALALTNFIVHAGYEAGDVASLGSSIWLLSEFNENNKTKIIEASAVYLPKLGLDVASAVTGNVKPLATNILFTGGAATAYLIKNRGNIKERLKNSISNGQFDAPDTIYEYDHDKNGFNKTDITSEYSFREKDDPIALRYKILGSDGNEKKAFSLELFNHGQVVETIEGVIRRGGNNKGYYEDMDRMRRKAKEIYNQEQATQ